MHCVRSIAQDNIYPQGDENAYTEEIHLGKMNKTNLTLVKF